MTQEGLFRAADGEDFMGLELIQAAGADGKGTKKVFTGDESAKEDWKNGSEGFLKSERKAKL